MEGLTKIDAPRFRPYQECPSAPPTRGLLLCHTQAGAPHEMVTVMSRSLAGVPGSAPAVGARALRRAARDLRGG
eukprot:13087-Prorocentrum_minimum.AAC.1